MNDASPVDPVRLGQLESLLGPKRVAVVGASSDPHKPSGMVLGFVAKSGFSGEVFPVNPRYQEIAGFPCYPSLEALPARPDLVVISTPTDSVLPVVEQCVEAAVPAALIMSGGFGEGSTGAEGRVRRDQLAEFVARGPTRVLGPNTVGLVNFTDRLPLTFADWYARDLGLRGNVAILTQSGSVGGLIFSLLQAGGVGVNHWIGLGNEVDLEVADFLMHFAGRDDVDIIVCFLEGLQDGCYFLDAANAVRRAGKTVVVLKAGRSASAQRSTLSHTGKLSSPARHYAAAFSEADVVETTSLRELVSVVQILAAPNRPREMPPTIGMMSASGGICSILADHASDAGLDIPELSAPVQAQLAKVIPAFGSPQNPVDLSANVIGREAILSGTLDTLRESREIGTWIVFGRPILDRFHERIAAEGKRFASTLIACSGVPLGAEAAASLRAGGVPLVEDPEYCIRAIGRLARRRSPPLQPSVRRGSGLKRKLGGRIADPRKVHAALAAHGLRVAESVFLRSRDELGQAQGLRFPLAVKSAMVEIPHKTEAGCVVLGVRDANALSEAVDQVLDNSRRAAPAAEPLIQLQEMSDYAHELILTITQDRDFGPMTLIGAGGVGVELADDTQVMLFPADRQSFLDALRRLRIWPLLAGYRGAAAADIDALADLHDGITHLYRAEPWVGEIELNPVLVGEHGALLIDALVTEAET